MAENTKTALDAAFDEIQETFGTTRTIRREMIDQLRSQIGMMKIDPYDKAIMIQAKLMIAKTLDDLLKSDEEVSIKKLKMQLARKDSETNGMVGATIVNLLKNIRTNGETAETNKEVDRAAALKELKAKQENNPDLQISEGETEACGTLPTTDSNIPTKPDKPKEEDE